MSRATLELIDLSASTLHRHSQTYTCYVGVTNTRFPHQSVEVSFFFLKILDSLLESIIYVSHESLNLHEREMEGDF